MGELGFLAVAFIAFLFYFGKEDKKRQEEEKAKREEQIIKEEQNRIEKQNRRDNENIKLLEEIIKDYQYRLSVIEHKYKDTIYSNENIKLSLQDLQGYIKNSNEAITSKAVIKLGELIEKSNYYSYDLNKFEYLCLDSKYNSIIKEYQKNLWI